MILSYSDLNNSLYNILSPQPLYTPDIIDYFTNLYYTGVRPTEIHRLDLWTIIDSNTAQLIPTKNNNPRTILRSQLTSRFWEVLESGSVDYYGYLYSKQLYFFEKWYQYQPCYVGAKSIDLYLFRHRYVKSLYLSGQTIPQITDHMGWINPLMAENYIFSTITTG